MLSPAKSYELHPPKMSWVSVMVLTYMVIDYSSTIYTESTWHSGRKPSSRNADGARAIFGNARRVWATTLHPDAPKKGLVPYSSGWWDGREIPKSSKQSGAYSLLYPVRGSGRFVLVPVAVSRCTHWLAS